MDHVKMEMDEFMPLGGLWAPTDLTFDVSHFDDLDVLGAQDGGLYEHSFKPEPEAEPHFELHDLLDVQGCLGLDWMEQPYLPSQSPEPEEPCVGESIAGLLEEASAVTVPACNTTTKTPSMSNDAALQLLASLKRQQEEVMRLDSTVITPVDLEVRVEMPLTAPPSPIAQVKPEIDIALIDSEETSGLEEVLCNSQVEFLHSPLSPVEIESFLSAPSPSVSPAPSTIDSSSLYSPGSSIVCSSSDLDNSFICNTSDLYEVVSNDGAKSTSRGCPYSRPQGSSKSTKSKGRKQTASIEDGPSELEIELMSKKDRKKLQNKNAAIRYRQKKKAESEEKRGEEEELEDENAKLKEKVEELSREIGYMKGLINEVRKARGLAPHKSCL